MSEKIPYDEIIGVLRDIEPGYISMTNEDIIEQIDAIYECNYIFKMKGQIVGFKNTITGLNLKIGGLHHYSADSIKETYENVWSKSNYNEVSAKEYKVKSLKAFFLALFSLFLLFFDSIILTYIIYFLFGRILYFILMQEYYRWKSKN